MSFFIYLLALHSFVFRQIVWAAPAPTLAPALDERTPSRTTTTTSIATTAQPLQLSGLLGGIASDLSEASLGASAFIQLFEAIVPTATPTSIPEVLSIASAAFPSPYQEANFVQGVEDLLENSLSLNDLEQYVLGGYLSGINSVNNVNPINPNPPVYPKKSPRDAPYSLTEAQLRAAIYIPSTFQYGKNGKQPVILSPGTGSFGGVNFQSNYIKLLSNSTFADLVWLNIPGALLGDAQVNAEYVAYAINYISGISHNLPVAVIGWSQASLDSQWAFKYWPSTRNTTTDYIGISPDIHGTVLAYALCPGFPQIPCDPAILQQTYNSNFITTLRANGGDSAYVPTTSIYSITDEIVQPQSNPNASAFYNDARAVGVTNNQLQSLCPGMPAGSVYTHEGVLYNAVAFALAVDALTHIGPGQPGRIDLAGLCQEFVAEGLSLGDVVATEGLIPLAVVNVLAYQPKVLVEPPIMPYAAVAVG